MSTTNTPRTHSATVGHIDDFPIGEMKMASVSEHRIAVIRTPSGLHALDNACPHEGYGLVTGTLDGEVVTCQWHNWKFDARTGRCLVGEEDVRRHDLEVSNRGDVAVTVTEPGEAERRDRLWPSLDSAIANHYVGQISRDAVRLLETGATPAEIMWAAFEPALAQNTYGPGHELAFATDCLAMATERSGEDRVLPLVQGLSALSEQSRGWPRRSIPAPDPAIDFQTAIEKEDVESAMAATMSLIESGQSHSQVRGEFINAVSRHHLSYGHGIIYTQKAFELLDLVGWQHAPSVLPHLAVTIVYSTREDALPYMRKAMEVIDAVNLGSLVATSRPTDWAPPSGFVDSLLDSPTPPISEVVSAVVDGAGIDDVLDALSIAASRRLLRHDLAVEFSFEEPVQWLDITHALTMTRAVRWAWENEPGEGAVRLMLFATWLLYDSGRAERRVGVGTEQTAGRATSNISDAIRRRDSEAALAAVSQAEPSFAGQQLEQASLEDPSGAFIVLAHLVKLTRAAVEETESTGSTLPLLAACRYLASPRHEGFVGRNVHSSLDFVRSGRPARR